MDCAGATVSRPTGGGRPAPLRFLPTARPLSSLDQGRLTAGPLAWSPRAPAVRPRHHAAMTSPQPRPAFADRDHVVGIRRGSKFAYSASG
jgi:hypothetical protein